MPSEPSTPEEAIAAMCSEMERTTVRAPRTIRFYQEGLATVVKVLRRGGLKPLFFCLRGHDMSVGAIELRGFESPARECVKETQTDRRTSQRGINADNPPGL